MIWVEYSTGFILVNMLIQQSVINAQPDETEEEEIKEL